MDGQPQAGWPFVLYMVPDIPFGVSCPRLLALNARAVGGPHHFVHPRSGPRACQYRELKNLHPELFWCWRSTLDHGLGDKAATGSAPALLTP